MGLNDADVRDVLRKLFRDVNVQYSVAPDIQGTVTVEFQRIPLDVALRNILDQVGGTFRIEEGIYVILRRGLRPGESGSTPMSYEKMPRFHPGEFSASCEVTNKALFLTADRSWGGTSDLLSEAADRAGFHAYFAYTYGDGFAFVLAVEATGKDGRPLGSSDRFRFEPKMDARDFRKISAVVHQAKARPPDYCRVLVLVVAATPIAQEGRPPANAEWRPAANMGLPDYARYQKWATDPKLTVLVYEFRRKHGKGDLVLRKLGEPGIAALKRVLGSGLWPARDLR